MMKLKSLFLRIPNIKFINVISFSRIQVRKNDKHSSNQTTKFKLDEYMFHIEEYYRQVKMSSNVKKKRIYVATDVPEIFVELERKYIHLFKFSTILQQLLF